MTMVWICCRNSLEIMLIEGTCPTGALARLLPAACAVPMKGAPWAWGSRHQAGHAQGGRRGTEARNPATPQRAEVEGCGQQAPFRAHVGQASQQEPPGAEVLFQDAKDWLHQLLPQGVHRLRRRSAHPDPVSAQVRRMGTPMQASPLGICGALPKGGAGLADGTSPLIDPVRRLSGMTPVGGQANEGEWVPIGAAVLIGLRFVAKTLLVVGVVQRALVGLGHGDPLAPLGTASQVGALFIAQPFEWRFTRQDLARLLAKITEPDNKAVAGATMRTTSAGIWLRRRVVA